MLAMCSSSIGFGPSVTNSTVRSSTLRGLPAAFEYARICEVSSAARWYENTTSSAVSGAPSWNLTPGRSLNRQVAASTCSHDVASPGTIFRSRSRITSVS